MAGVCTDIRAAAAATTVAMGWFSMMDQQMSNRPRWQSLVIVFMAITTIVLIPVLIINRWLNMPIWGIILFSAIVAGLIVNKYFAHKIF